MSTEMTMTSEVEEYCEAVRDALADLPAEAREDLLEDLADHLAEVAAEGEGTLLERLGEPAAYALDLRAAAGYDAPEITDAAFHDRFATAWRRGVAATSRADARLGQLVGYPRLSQLVRALAPGWWVLRGWIVAQLVCARRDYGWTFIPRVGSSGPLGLAITLALVVVSVLIGRNTVRWSAWPRGAAYAASAAVAIWGIVVLAPYLTQTNYSFQSAPVDSGSFDSVSDLYVYDQNGNLVPNARIFDQSGNQIQDGDPDCGDGNRGAIDNAVDPYLSEPTTNNWTYPLCPNDPNRPFRSGPGTLVTPSAPASAGIPTATSTAPVKPATPAASSTP